MEVGKGTLSTLKKSDKEVYGLLDNKYRRTENCREYHDQIFADLERSDSQVYELITDEYKRVQSTLQLIAAENQCSKAVLAALGSVVQNKTTEGFPGARFHGGCEIVDNLERLAANRAMQAFGARYANVQPHSGTAANQIVLTALLARGDKILSLGLDQGGHLSHGAKVSFTGKFFDAEHYYVDKTTFLLDYELIRKTALRVRPKLIICGATAYTRAIDFKKFREIADEVGAYLLADISHISGLVSADAHQSPINYAHVTTTSTYKPGGPRGGLILIGKDKDMLVNLSGKNATLCKHIEKATFPGVQGTPYLNHIAAKAVFFKELLSTEYKDRQFKIIENAERLANNLLDLGYNVLTGGTDNHMVLINVTTARQGLTGVIAQNCLEQCGIIVNMNKLPYDKKPTTITSGVRFGTPIVTRNGMEPKEMDIIADMIDSTLKRVEIIDDNKYKMSDSFAVEMLKKVENLCGRFPVY